MVASLQSAKAELSRQMAVGMQAVENGEALGRENLSSFASKKGRVEEDLLDIHEIFQVPGLRASGSSVRKSRRWR